MASFISLIGSIYVGFSVVLTTMIVAISIYKLFNSTDDKIMNQSSSTESEPNQN